VLKRVPVGSQPRDLVYDGSNVWVVNQRSDSLSRLSP